MRATLEILRQTMVQLLQSRMVWVVLGIELVIALCAFALGRNPPREISGRHLYAVLAFWGLLGTLLPWTTMYFGVQAVHGDIEDRTFQYLFLRPIPRAAILLGKFLAVAVLCAVLFGIGVLALFAGLALHAERWPDGVEYALPLLFAAAAALASLAYAAVAVWFAARFRRPMVWTAFFIVGLQMLVGNMPARAGVRLLTIADPVRRFLLDGLDPDRRLAQALWPAERDFRSELIGAPVLNLLVLSAAGLLLGLLAYVRSEYDSRARE